MLNKLKIGPKLIGGFLCVAAIAAFLGIMGFINVEKMNAECNKIYESMTVPISIIADINPAFQQMRVATRDMVRHNQPETIERDVKKIEAISDSADKFYQEFEKRIVSEEMRKIYNDCIDKRKAYKEVVTELVELAKNNKDSAAYAIIESGRGRDVSDAYQAVIDAMQRKKIDDAKKCAEEAAVTARNIATLLVTMIIIGIVLAVILGIFLTLSITRPITRGVAMMQEMAKGHLGMRLKMDRSDEIGMLAEAMDGFAEDLQKNVVATVTKIGEGDVSSQLKPKDSQDEITPAILKTLESLRSLISEMNHMSEEHDKGDIDITIAAEKFQGAYKLMAQGVNGMVNGHIAVKKKAMACIAEFGKGNFDTTLETFPGKKVFINNTIEQVRKNLKALVVDANMLSKAAIEGKLSTRADAGKHDGDFRKIIQGVNDTLDAVIGPLNVAAKYVDDISKGNIPPKITDNYNGDFNAIKGNLNQCIDAVNLLVADAAALAKAAVEGKLATRADASKHFGDFRKIVQGVDDCLDAVIGPLNVAAKYVDDISKGNIPQKITDNYNGDFNTIKNNLNQCIGAINSLVADAGMLSKAAVEGKLATRADASKHFGDFRKIVQGVDDCLDAVIGPLNVAAKYVDDISKGNIPPLISDNYNGDFNTIKNNLNSVVKMMSDLLKETDGVIKAAADGELDKRADAGLFVGGWNQLVAGVNDTITNIVNPLMITAEYVDKISKGIIPPEITAEYKGQYNIIKTNLNQCIKTLQCLIVDDGGKVLEAAAQKDLSKRLVCVYTGQFNTMKENINNVLNSLDSALSQVYRATEQVSSASQQISSGSQSLAQGANEQASSLEEVSSSLEEMSSMTKQNAENANQAKSLAAEANGNAAQGKQAMQRMSDAITKIKDSSDETAKIVKTIDEIAMQTNLLALNAAVEAARAGEAGRGFAVVAEEVRNLAQRSAEAAKNTANMIEESVKNAEEGVQISLDVAKSFDVIAGSNAKVDGLIAEIAAASNEQSQGIDQVNTAVAQMDKVTQQNAANSEESASAAEELSSQAEELQSMVTQFRLSSIEAAAAPAKTAVHQMERTAPIPKMMESAKPKNGNGKTPTNRKPLQKELTKAEAEEKIPLDDEVLKEF